MQTSRLPLVLIADDERNAVILLTRIFERDGFAVENARDGEEALDKARSLRPDLILMDVQMPKMNGFQVVERLREEQSTARIPIIFVTAAAREPSDAAHGFQLGADDYIRKPYNNHELLARAHSKMRARQLEDQLQQRNEELEALVRVGTKFNQYLSLDDLSELVLIIASRELDAEQAELFLFGDKVPILYRNITQGMQPLEQVEAILADEDQIASHVFRTGEPVLIARAEQSLFHSAVAAPLRHHGNLIGVLTVARETPKDFDEGDLRLLRSIGEQAALAVHNAQLYAELQRYAQNLETMVEERTQELRTAQAQLILTEKMAALGQLAAGVAHEVNNPLQPILNCLEVAIEDLESGQAVDVEGLRVAEAEVQRIKTIVSQLLDFSRPDTEKAVEKVDLHALTQEVLKLASKQLEQMQVRVHTQLESVPSFNARAMQLKQVILNLVINAMEAMPAGGDLTIEAADVRDGIENWVSDTGIGMDDETAARIFDPFYSTKEDGTGLGLAVSYGIIEGHGGDIRVESQPGRGSRFTIWLPYHPT